MNESRKRAVTIFTIILSLIPIPFILNYPNSTSMQALALYISAVVGYAGIVLMLWMYILGTKAVTTLAFKDLAPVLSIHKWLGKYAIPLIFVHPILITVSKSEAWFYSLIPKVGTVTERHILLGQIAIGLLGLTWFISAYLRERIGFRPWKYLHYLAYICVPFALLHVPDLGSQEQGSIVVKAYLFLLGLVFIGFSFLRLRSLMNLDRATYEIVAHNQLTDIDRQLIVRPIDKSLEHPEHGQYVYIKLGYISEDHPFSVTAYNADTQEITLTYRTSGMYTKELAKLSDGNHVFMSGPFGSFTSELSTHPSKPIVYISGGIGVTPFVSRIIHDASSREQWLFAANRNKATAVLSSTLKTVLGERHVAVFNRESAPLDNQEESGYITAALLTKYLSNPRMYDYYLCGPAPMMEAVKKEFNQLGIEPSAIHTEKFGW